ncbi:uncharacterized protein LOC118471314 [Amphiprion ocellaris]|uniref:uncharacterized protein LOC118471314 n=1 Tax=Amphiprion ocellaris TaxID=80972 RepID=UPI002411208E|nr:uncharacterized protein LOC118471314 [Amphiprion ocellaris]
MSRSYAATLAAVLPTRLDGAAFLLWDILPPSVQCDFESVKEKLNEAFGQKQFLLYFQTCVSARTRQANESLELYAADISRLVAEAFPEYDMAALNGEKFRRFLAGLDPGLRAKCHEQGASDLEEALMIAGRCERARMALGVGTQTSPYSPATPPPPPRYTYGCGLDYTTLVWRASFSVLGRVLLLGWINCRLIWRISGQRDRTATGRAWTGVLSALVIVVELTADLPPRSPLSP